MTPPVVVSLRASAYPFVSNAPMGIVFGTADTFYDTPPPSPPKTAQMVAKTMVIQRLMFGFWLLEAPHKSDIIENKPERGNFQLLVVFRFFCFVSCVDFASPNQLLYLWGVAIVESICRWGDNICIS